MVPQHGKGVVNIIKENEIEAENIKCSYKIDKCKYPVA